MSKLFNPHDKFFKDVWLVAFHLIRYMVKIWDLGLKQQEYEKGFPAIIPEVNYGSQI